MSESNRLATVREALEKLGLSSTLSPNKAITVAELEELISQLPKGLATTDHSNPAMIAEVMGLPSYNLLLIENHTLKAININCGYSNISIDEGMYGGWMSAEDSSGSTDRITFNQLFDGYATVRFMRRTGPYQYSDAGQKSVQLTNSGYDQISVPSQVAGIGGHIYCVQITLS